jgi:hypothetical protein
VAAAVPFGKRAGEFKRIRLVGFEDIEYNAFYDRHGPLPNGKTDAYFKAVAQH